MQMPSLESRVASLEAVQGQISERLGSIESRLTSMEQGQRELSTHIDNRLTDMDSRNNSNFKWLMGLLVIVLLANVGTAVSITIALTKP